MWTVLWTESATRAIFVPKISQPAIPPFPYLMQRTLEPELLDSLPPDHPDAQHSRRDLRLTNAVLGNHRWLERTVPRLMRPNETALELGAGTGELGLRLQRAGVNCDGLDLWPRPETWHAASTWHRGDLKAFPGYADYPVLIGNLIFHQFSNSDLTTLGSKLCRQTRVIVACEPHRRRISQTLYRTFAPLFGANHVTLHDAHISIAAGFRGDDLPLLLGLATDTWSITCTTTLLGLYRMVAIRREPAPAARSDVTVNSAVAFSRTPRLDL